MLAAARSKILEGIGARKPPPESGTVDDEALVAALQQAKEAADREECESVQQQLLTMPAPPPGGVALTFEHELALTWRQSKRIISGPSGHVWFTLQPPSKPLRTGFRGLSLCAADGRPLLALEVRQSPDIGVHQPRGKRKVMVSAVLCDGTGGAPGPERARQTGGAAKEHMLAVVAVEQLTGGLSRPQIAARSIWAAASGDARLIGLWPDACEIQRLKPGETAGGGCGAEVATKTCSQRRRCQRRPDTAHHEPKVRSDSRQPSGSQHRCRLGRVAVLRDLDGAGLAFGRA